MYTYKKIVIILIFILLAEVGIVIVFLTSFENFATQGKTSNESRPQGEQLALPEKLILFSGKKSFELSSEKVHGLIQKNRTVLEPKKDSLNNYYFAQTRLSSTNLSNLDMLKRPALNYRALGEYLTALTSEIDRDPNDAKLAIENNRATIFIPHLSGQDLNLYETQNRIIEALAANAEKVELSVVTTLPQKTLGQLNDLDIKELIVTGQSDFTGSSASRIQNIRVGSSQYNGLIIKPGEEFSFNEHLGPIDAAHGYKPELVIKPEGATPEFGGGLCQVSTTAFRAAFFGGLPITARRNHSYAVKYYEWISDDIPRAVGLDATIYSGVQDMKFVNDTPGAILVWTRMEGKRLYFDFYGTKDEREILVDGPHPYDRRESGAVKSKVTRVVKKPGAPPVEIVFQSNYVPPKTLPAVIEYPQVPPPDEANNN
ncbi:MAG: VanW family protein [bacterium]|nr:VanW family protein [bacterium]